MKKTILLLCAIVASLGMAWGADNMLTSGNLPIMLQRSNHVYTDAERGLLVNGVKSSSEDASVNLNIYYDNKNDGFYFDLGEAKKLGFVKIYWTGKHCTNYKIYASNTVPTLEAPGNEIGNFNEVGALSEATRYKSYVGAYGATYRYVAYIPDETANFYGSQMSEFEIFAYKDQTLGSITLPYCIWSATQGFGGISATVSDVDGDDFAGAVTLSWEGNAPVGAVIDGMNLTFGAASGAGTYTLKATSGGTSVTTPVYMIGTNPDAPTANAADVLAIYSDTYSANNYDGWGTGYQWGYAAKDIIPINGNNCVRIHNVGTYGFPYPDADLTQYTKLHFDIYTTAVTTGHVMIEKTNINNMSFTTTAGAWKHVAIDLAGLTMAQDGNRWVDIFVGENNTDKSRDVLIDNVYFENEIPVVPTTSITVTAPAATVAVGKTLQLTVKNQGNNTLDPSDITFVSSDDTKASVSVDGVVTGVAEGDVTITATVKGSDPAISNTINLTVVPAPAGLELTAGGHTILIQGKHFVNLAEDNWQVIITSDDDLSGLGGSFWTLSSGGSDMRTNLSLSGDKKTMIITASSTTKPSLYTPLYVTMPGEVNFCEGSYFNENMEWVEYASITPAYNKTTYVTTSALDFSAVDGLKAYVATAANAANVTMTKVEDPVPAGTPLLLIGTAGTTYNVPVVTTASAPAGNLLRAGDGTTVIGGTSRYDYILYTDGLFYRANEGALAAGKAYLHLDTAPAGARSLNIVFDDEEVTSISEELRVKSEKSVPAAGVFDLQGRKVAQPQKGLYIVNGKKVLVP